MQLLSASNHCSQASVGCVHGCHVMICLVLLMPLFGVANALVYGFCAAADVGAVGAVGGAAGGAAGGARLLMLQMAVKLLREHSTAEAGAGTGAWGAWSRGVLAAAAVCRQQQLCCEDTGQVLGLRFRLTLNPKLTLTLNPAAGFGGHILCCTVQR